MTTTMPTVYLHADQIQAVFETEPVHVTAEGDDMIALQRALSVIRSALSNDGQLERIGKLAIEVYLAKCRFDQVFTQAYDDRFIGIDPTYEAKRLARLAAEVELNAAIGKLLAKVDKS